MRKARSEEYWDNIGRILGLSRFLAPRKLPFPRPFSVQKSTFFAPLCFETPFQCLQKMKNTRYLPIHRQPHFAPSFSPQKHRFPALSRRNATPAPHFPVQTPMKSVLIFLAPRIIHLSPMYYFRPPACTKTHSKMYLLRRAFSTFSDTARLGILSLWR